ncbi:MAG: sodium:calcium antiporter, partial [Candidatus Neomarinimicrobiota bacterium]
MLVHIVSVLGGLILLIVGADSLVRGSSGIALRLGVSALAVGLTVVAFGTSAPELVVSLNAAMIDKGSISLGNIIGSNIANIALILGLCAILSPIRIHAQLFRRDVPVAILATVVLTVMIVNNSLGRLEGLILFLLFGSYLGTTIYLSRRERDEHLRKEFKQAVPARPQKLGLLLLLIIVGLGLLVLGAHLFVAGAIALARRLAVSEAVIG